MTRPTLRFDLRLTLGAFELRAAAAVGPATAILGPSGAGKSTLLQAIAGLRRAQGTVELDGVVLLDSARGVDLPPERRRLGLVPQDGLLFPHLSVRRNLLFGRRDGAPGGGDGDELGELVSALELAPLLDRYPRYLSGGETRRVALGRALLSRPRLLLLDEPTAGLDDERARRARGHVLRAAELTGTPLLVVTHELREALALAREIVVLDAGRVRHAGEAGRLAARGVPELLPREGRHANVVRGTVAGHDPEGGVTTVALDEGRTVSIPLDRDLAVGSAVVLSVDAEEVLVAVREPQGLSARNVVAGEVEALDLREGSVFVRAGGWVARLTPAASRELALGPGRRVWMAVKTHSWRVLAG